MTYNNIGLLWDWDLNSHTLLPITVLTNRLKAHLFVQ